MTICNQSHLHPLRRPHHDLDLLPVGEDTEPAEEGDEGINRHSNDDCDVVNIEEADDDNYFYYFNPNIDRIPDQSGNNVLVFSLLNAVDEEAVGDQGDEVQHQVDNAPGQGGFVEKLQIFYAKFIFQLLHHFLKFFNNVRYLFWMVI